ncbi:phage baseplate assembly protein V [Laribacter hongkongensis]|uniref:Phage baseplate protein n=2 Tax=Laribacter hongkongensis TaxID=168471 RepID=A0A248LJ19_9NEIS|nr:phage baseplate assembly protein V [Laribacter hongkongensis]ASJ24163.1 phage baseplate protein [Laribacter hongkongensis]MCG9060190.1 phage baseplate assembly protein V [Laribacter hongkongensis]MCG9087299.1 phage baseplate assembly protein V [Laribacter hongkongensis]MCG9088061.1 phage baseplate assembly protein V [Laribacter hongkongensis]MCG9110368.1 phage baseplate assembly protein V [Laribacter hongkongensis]
MLADIDRRIGRALAGIRQAFRGVLRGTRGGKGSQLAQVDGLAGEPLPDLELFQQFGFTSNPPAGTAVVVLPLGGRTSHGIIVATENGAYRIGDLKPGETAIFNAFGDRFVFRDGRIDGTTKAFRLVASEGMEFDTPTAQFTGAVTIKDALTGRGGMAISGGDGARVEGSLHATGDVSAGDISLTGHQHDGDSGGMTSCPKIR